MPKPVSKPTAKSFTIEPGSPHPLGTTLVENGINFSLFSEHATGVELLLFENHDDLKPFQTVVFDPIVNKLFISGTYSSRMPRRAFITPCASMARTIQVPDIVSIGKRYDRSVLKRE